MAPENQPAAQPGAARRRSGRKHHPEDWCKPAENRAPACGGAAPTEAAELAHAVQVAEAAQNPAARVATRSEAVSPAAHPHADIRRYFARKVVVLIGMAIAVLLAAGLVLKAGSSGLSIAEIWEGITNRDSGREATIMWNLRLPRTALAIVVGASLAVAGVIMQSVLRNPLASASTLGVSQGAGFGAAVAIIYFGAGSQINSPSGAAVSVGNSYVVATFAFLGGIGTTAIILAISRMRRVSPTAMVLAGVALSAVFNAGTSLVQYFADEVQVASVVYWTFGSLGRASWNQIGLIAALLAAALIFFMANMWNYNALESGTATAKSLGVNVDVLIPVSLAICALISAISVAFCGVIGFIGLIAPHMMRRLVGNDFRFLIPATALCGAALLLLADVASRTLIAPTVLPIGAITSIVGAPIFLYLLLRRGFNE
ncbi:iron complex transport system permease protein [Actinobaculum suis]|uniref:Iron ABC transporter permease n=1 Tax=Actinobaculum suis TaxID=1657 RepID=A0A1G7DUQ6_9ACTO|nr:iron ABC transporter permease [Actinobaculum suis]MDY5152874.1 iron ABC transporter permease [Actinobaculum suis]SDE55203.1 iron complex transport system permease protein [Actinobaculum suis]